MHRGVHVKKEFMDLFEIKKKIVKFYKKPFIRNVEEGTFIANHNGEILNSTPNLRTKATFIQEGA